MKIRIVNLCLLIATCFAFNTSPDVSKDQLIQQSMLQGLSEVHYHPQEINDDFSNRIYDLYMKRLDYNKKFLLKEDVSKLEKYRNQIGDEIRANTFDFFNLSYDIITQRIAEAQSYYKDILSQPFDFTVNENVELDEKKLSYSASKDDLKNEWRKYLKYEVLTRISDELDAQDKAKEKNDTSYHAKSFDQIEADARKKVLKLNNSYFKRLSEYNKEKRIGGYFDVIANTYDPHTEFFPPADKKEFDARMSGHFEGIGAQLQQTEDGTTKVTSIVPGSASYKQGQLKSGDIILKVAQGSNTPVDIAGMPLDSVVQLIRGKKGTEVRLTIKKPDASTIVIPIIRDKVETEETFAKSAILNFDNKKVGYLKLPEFYADFEHRDGRHCSEDVKKELEKLKADNVDGIILDLRDNGGGSLEEAVKMAGLFFTTGPVVQVRDKENRVKVLNDEDPGVTWNGPLAVMVNTNSASASEILAAAMQDYKRGIIVGSPSTFGKGTVQQFIDLDDVVPSEYNADKPLGSVKITIQKFYRINGGSTQLKGVIPDIVIPDPYTYIDEHEKDQEYPLKWDEIPAAKYNTLDAVPYEKVEKNAKEREKANPSIELLSEDAQRMKKTKDDESYSLNLEKYRAEQKKLKEENKKYEALNKEIPEFTLEIPKADIQTIQSDSSKTSRNKEWFKSIRKDANIYETAHIVEDMK